MADSDTIETFLVTDIPAVVAGLSGTRQVYAGQAIANIRKPFSALVRYLRKIDLSRDQKKVRHSFKIGIRRQALDQLKEDVKSKIVKAAAELIEDAYDGAIGVFRTGTSLNIERVRCFREKEIDTPTRGSVRVQELTIEIDLWE